MDDLEGAERKYGEAEPLYRKIHDDLGLANVLKLQGDLAMRVDDLEGAERKYGEAEILYRKVHSMIGLAYTISELCFLSAKKDDMDKVIDYATQAEEMFDLIPYESVKKYVAQKVVQAFELLGNDK